VPEPGELDEPAPADGVAVLDVLAAGRNPVDARIASGTFPERAPRATLISAIACSGGSAKVSTWGSYSS
jgi:NADPH:quinone reductase-like Zn-dependent oxidoreductase